MTDTLRSTLYSLVTTTQMKSPGIYSFHELRRFSAMMSAGMMNGARDLSVLMHMKSKSPAIDDRNAELYFQCNYDNGMIQKKEEMDSCFFLRNLRILQRTFENFVWWN